jgi:hypothetical protein
VLRLRRGQRQVRLQPRLRQLARARSAHQRGGDVGGSAVAVERVLRRGHSRLLQCAGVVEQLACCGAAKRHSGARVRQLHHPEPAGAVAGADGGPGAPDVEQLRARHVRALRRPRRDGGGGRGQRRRAPRGHGAAGGASRPGAPVLPGADVAGRRSQDSVDVRYHAAAPTPSPSCCRPDIRCRKTPICDIR